MTYFTNFKRTLLKHDRPSYIHNPFYLLLTNVSHLLVIFVLLTSKDVFLSIISLLYISTDIPWHSIKNSKKINYLKIFHRLFIIFFIFYVFIKLCFGFYKKKNIFIFIPIIIYFLLEHFKGRTITDKKQQYKIFEFYEPFVHSYIWLGLTFLNLYYPEFNIPF